MAGMRTIDLPYCYQCAKKKTDGYRHKGDQIWVCAICHKPTYLFWISQMLVEKYWHELDELFDRIMEKRENADGLDRGRAETACLFIAMLLSPHDPDPKHVR